MTPGEHTARALALRDARLVPLEWLTVVQILDTECPPKPTGIVRIAQPTPPRPVSAVYAHPRPRVVHRRRRRSWRQIVYRATCWTLARVPAAVVIGGALLLTWAAFRGMTP